MTYPHLNEKPAGGSSVSSALFNWLILGAIGFFSYPFISGFFSRPDQKDIMTEAERLEQLNITVYYPTFEPVDQLSLSSKPVVVVTPTPSPTDEEEGYLYYKFGYSYYFPDLGGVNCHEDNWNVETFKCKDVTASGKSWRQNMKRGVALHYDQLFDLPFGTLIQVLKPVEIAGYYEVIDICPGCNPRYEGQHYFIDFLDDKQRLPWGEIVEIRVKK